MASALTGAGRRDAKTMTLEGVPERIPMRPARGQALRAFLFVLMALSAAAALFLAPALEAAVKRRALSPAWLFTPLAVYGLFLLVYGVDRWLLVRRRGYPAGKAFFQVAFGLFFALLLLPSTMGDWNTRQRHGMSRLLTHPDVEVRVVAVEALGYRGFDVERLRLLLPYIDDGEARVKGAARAVLGAWARVDPSDLEGIRRWTETQIATSSKTQGGN